jgi:hypothetical protein
MSGQKTTYTTSSSYSLLSEIEEALRLVEQKLRAAEIEETTWDNYWRSLGTMSIDIDGEDDD